VEAKIQRDKYKRKARTQGITINGAIALQVLVGAITTGVAAGAKNVGTSVAILGGLSTTLASYLAKVRGSGEPEFSTLRSRELSTFVRELDDFLTDHGHKVTTEFDDRIMYYRGRFEDIIRTEGEDSNHGGPRGQHPGQQSANGMYGGGGGGQYPAKGGTVLTEKQQMLQKEKALSAMV